MTGIEDYGVYLPRYRLPLKEYGKGLGQVRESGFEEKRVNDFDEDAVTMAVEAARVLLSRRPRPGKDITYMGVATTTGPYDGRVMGGTLGAMLGLGNEVFSSEHTSSPKAGLEALIEALGRSDEALVVAGEVPAGTPRSSWEEGSGAAAAAILTGSGDLLARAEACASFCEERLGLGVRARGEADFLDLGIPSLLAESYETCVMGAIRGLLEKTGSDLADYRFVVLPHPGGALPGQLARKAGITEEQAAPARVFRLLGNLNSAGPLVGLAAALDMADPQDRILVASFAPGSGSDALALSVTDRILEHPGAGLDHMLSSGQVLDFFTYARLRSFV
ncbi:MAG: hypothetical protein AB1576_02680 [Bacillota bacterium]